MKAMKKLPYILLLILLAVYLCAAGAAGPAVQAAISNAPDGPCVSAPLRGAPCAGVSVLPDCAVSTGYAP